MVTSSYAFRGMPDSWLALVPSPKEPSCGTCENEEVGSRQEPYISVLFAVRKAENTPLGSGLFIPSRECGVEQAQHGNSSLLLEHVLIGPESG